MPTIITAPNPILSREAKPVVKINPQIRKLIREMKETLNQASDPEGVGLAAPQVGQSYRIFIAKPTPKSKALVFINPEIVKSYELGVMSKPKKKKPITHNSKPKTKLEGCLSLKDIWGTVLRSPKITLSYQDEAGKKQTKEFKDFLATIIQHEYDHLNGVLFPKRVLEQKGKLYKSSKDEKGEDVFEELEI